MPTKKSAELRQADTLTASGEINAQIAATPGFRGDLLATLRQLIHAAVPDVVETIKWQKPSLAECAVSRDGRLRGLRCRACSWSP